MDTPPPPAPQPTPAPAQTAPAPAPAATLAMDTERDRVVLAGDRVRVAGRLSPAMPGQDVVVRVYRGTRKVAVKRVRVGADGAFRTRVAVGSRGPVVIRASHRATPELGSAVARGRRVDVLPRRVSGGSSRATIRLLQRHLAKRGYVVGRAGVLDGRTSRAVLAFRKVTGLSRIAVADGAVMRRIADGGGYYRLRYPKARGRHVEGDLSRQVLVLANGSKVERIYHTSSGAPATPTIRGTYRFYLSTPGLNAKGMFWSRFFIRGYAIHGYKSVPTYPASHGCFRVPMEDALSIYRWIRIGDRIDVYL